MTTVPFTKPAPDAAPEQPTEAQYAERFAAAYSERLRFLHARGEWFEFTGHTWRPDRDGGIVRHALEFVRGEQKRVVQGPGDRGARQAATKFAITAESKNFLDRLIGLAKNFHPLADTGDGWDSEPWLLGAPNGTINLQSGELRAGLPADRVTLSVRAPFDTAATCPRFERFLSEVLDNDAELVEFLQRFVGYCLTGSTREQVLAILHGTGANGKTTLLNVIAWVLGDYADNLPFASIERQRTSIPNDLAKLAGKRFVTASETNDGTRLNEARLKALTGSDPISARFLHGEWFTFTPVAKFLLAVNHKPAVRDDSVGFWRRIRLVPLVRSFSGSVRDDSLEDQLKAEGPGILRWAVDGALAWQRDGLPTPPAVMAATQDYQEDSDVLAEFLDQACDIEGEASVRASDIQDAYQRWADKQRLGRHDRLSAKDFGRRMAERFTRRKTMTGWVYAGVKVATTRLW